MLTNLMQDQRQRLIQAIQEKPGYVQADLITALALLDILEILQDIRNPFAAN